MKESIQCNAFLNYVNMFSANILLKYQLLCIVLNIIGRVWLTEFTSFPTKVLHYYIHSYTHLYKLNLCSENHLAEQQI